jgi:hypothetical protein
MKKEKRKIHYAFNGIIDLCARLIMKKVQGPSGQTLQKVLGKEIL